MILWILGIGVAGLYLSFVMMKGSILRWLLVAVTGVITLGSIFLMVDNDRDHFGMKKVTSQETLQIYSASPSNKLSLLLYQNIGTSGKHSVYIYKTNPKSKATTTTVDYNVKNSVTQNSSISDPTVKQTRIEWQYKSGFYKMLFNDENNHALIRQTYDFQIPNSWYTLTTDQAKKLGQKMKDMQKQMKNPAQQAAMKAIIQKQVMAARMKDPTMTPQQQAALIKKITSQVQQQAINKVISEVKK